MMANEIDRRLVTIPFTELDEYPAGKDRPRVATVREIDADVDGDISFFFSRATYSVDLATYPLGLKGLLDDLRTDSFKYTDDAWDRPQPPMSPLSLNNHRLSYVVYKLTARNWQFSRDHPPFSIGKKGKNAKVHFEARRIDKSGKIDWVVRRRPVKNGCMVAYFISDGFEASGFTGQYVHAINIHVDLVFGRRRRAYVPLMIDPDIRHPGGSGA